MSNNIFYYDLTFKELTRKEKILQLKAKGLGMSGSPDRTIIELFA